jgi:hypothetical protein
VIIGHPDNPNRFLLCGAMRMDNGCAVHAASEGGGGTGAAFSQATVRVRQWVHIAVALGTAPASDGSKGYPGEELRLYIDGSMSAAVGLPGIRTDESASSGGSSSSSGGNWGLNSPFVFPRPWPSTLHFGPSTSLAAGGGSDTNDDVAPFTGIVSGVHLQLNLHRQKHPPNGDHDDDSSSDTAALELEQRLVKQFSARSSAGSGASGSTMPTLPPIPRVLWPGNTIRIRKAEEEAEAQQKEEKEAEEKAKREEEEEKRQQWAEMKKAKSNDPDGADGDQSGETTGQGAGEDAGEGAGGGAEVDAGKESLAAINKWFREKETTEERTKRELQEARLDKERRNRQEAREHALDPVQAIATGMMGPPQLFQLAMDYRTGNWSCVVERIAQGRERHSQHGSSNRPGSGPTAGADSSHVLLDNTALADAERESDWNWELWRPCLPDSATAHVALLMSSLSTALMYSPKASNFPPRRESVNNLTDYRSFAALAHTHHTGSAAHSPDVDATVWQFEDTVAADLHKPNTHRIRRVEAANGLEAPRLGIDWSSLPSHQTRLFYQLGLAAAEENEEAVSSCTNNVGTFAVRPNPVVAASYLQIALGLLDSINMAIPRHGMTNAEVWLTVGDWRYLGEGNSQFHKHMLRAEQGDAASQLWIGNL